MKVRLGAIALAASIFLVGCDGQSDTTGPTPGVSSSFSDVQGQSLTVSWDAASDLVTPSAALQYKLLYSTENNAVSVEDIEANWTVAMDWSTNVLTSAVNGLTPGQNYFFSILVRDTSDNKSAYTLASQATVPANTMLACPAGQVMTGISGRRGGIIDKLTLRCAEVNLGAVDTGSTAAADSVGAEGGQPFADFTCPAGEWVVGVNGGNGLGAFPTAMASVQVTCSGGSQSPAINNNVGENPFNFTCGAGAWATGFEINSTVGGSYAGFMEGITCEQLPR